MMVRTTLTALIACAALSRAVRADAPIPILRQIERPTEIRAVTDTLVVRSQFAVLDWFFSRRDAGLTVYADAYAGRGSLNRATTLAIRAAFVGRAFPREVTDLTERQRATLLVDGGARVALALELIRDLRPLHGRGSKWRAAARSAVMHVRSRWGDARIEEVAGADDTERLERIRGEVPGPIAIVLAAPRTLAGHGTVYVDLPDARGVREFEAARGRPDPIRAAGCNYNLKSTPDRR